jgi:flagellar assembly factor FliW
MILTTPYFGPLAVNESAALEFPQGLPGFENCRRFVPLEHPAHPGLIFLQSMERLDLCFLAVPVRSIRPEYRPALSAEDLELLDLAEDRQPEIGTEVAALAILSLAPGEAPTANLLSPVVVSIATGRAVQAIRPDDTYGCREPVAPLEAVCS